MKKFLFAVVMAVPFYAIAGDDGGSGSTHRYDSHGPAWWEVPCGLPCFAIWRLDNSAMGLQVSDLDSRALRKVKTPQEMRALLAKAQRARRK